MFTKSNNMFLGFFDPIFFGMIIIIMINIAIVLTNHFRDDLSDISAKTKTLVPVCASTLVPMPWDEASDIIRRRCNVLNERICMVVKPVIIESRYY